MSLPASRAVRLLPWLLVAAMVGWASYGWWPVVALEGDDQGVIFGVQAMAGNDAVRLPLRYLYEIQPGSYQLLAALTRLTGAPAETVFAWATAAGALAFACFGAGLIRRLVGLPLGWALVLMLWCQEVTAAACYANTCAIAAGPALAAVLLAVSGDRPRHWVGAGLGLGLAGWLRADSLLVSPAVLALLYWREPRALPAIVQTTRIAVVAVLAFIALLLAAGVSPVRAVQAYAERPNLLGSWSAARDTALVLLSPALLVAILAGLGRLLRRRETPLLLVVAAGCLPSIAIYGASLTTPKYFYYLIPFALLPAAALARAAFTAEPPAPAARRKWVLATVLVAALADLFVGLRVLKAEWRLLDTSPTLATLAGVRLPGRDVALVIGPGELLSNADGFRVRTGQGFAPLCWHREKTHLRQTLAQIRAVLQSGRNSTFYWSSWLPRQLLFRELLALGFQPGERYEEGMGTYQGNWQRGGTTVCIGFLGYEGSPFQPAGPAPASATPADTYFLGDSFIHWPVTPLRDERHWTLLSEPATGFVRLYQRL